MSLYYDSTLRATRSPKSQNLAMMMIHKSGSNSSHIKIKIWKIHSYFLGSWPQEISQPCVFDENVLFIIYCTVCTLLESYWRFLSKNNCTIHSLFFFKYIFIVVEEEHQNRKFGRNQLKFAGILENGLWGNVVKIWALKGRNTNEYELAK